MYYLSYGIIYLHPFINWFLQTPSTTPIDPFPCQWHRWEIYHQYQWHRRSLKICDKDYLPVSLTLVINIYLRISPRIFEIIWNGPNGILGGPGDNDYWKKPEVNNLVSDSLWIPVFITILTVIKKWYTY